jgi:hypothetical protein
VKQELITFPSGGEWEDSGEGGMYALLVVKEPLEWRTNCNVDVHTLIQRNRPDAKRSTTVRMTPHDVCVSSQEAKLLWAPYNYQSSGYQHDAAKVLRSKGMAVEAQWVERADDPDDYSTSMLATAFLGSTSQSLFSEERGAYFEATIEDLTEQGRALHRLYKSAYGIKPVILTFLDT